MGKVIDGVSYVTADEAAGMMATTPLRVLMLMREKALCGTQQEGEWLVTSDSVAEWLANSSDMKMETRCASSCAQAHGCDCKSR